jgi:hypothetical protein
MSRVSGLASRKGQVSVEYLAGAIIVLSLFLIVFLFTEQTRIYSEAAQINTLELETCTKVSSIITYMSSNPPYSETQFEISQDLNVVNGNIFVGDIFCPFLGTASNTELYAGIIRAFDINGTVLFTNDLNYSPFITPPGAPDTNANQSEDIFLLIDDQNQTWYAEVLADDVSYAVSSDDSVVDPDWVEFRFANSGLTSANQPTSVSVLINHFESYHVGLGGIKSMVQCYNGNTWLDVETYIPSFTEEYYASNNLAWCISDWNLVNNARIRMTYEPSGVNHTLSIDYARLDVDFTQDGILLDLWDHFMDSPQPVDFSTDVNSSANTFGPDGGNDGWDWNQNHFGGDFSSSILFNADPNYDGTISDSTVSASKRLEIKLGGNISSSPSNPDDNSSIGPIASGAYGVQFDINAETYTDLSVPGTQLLLSFTYYTDADAGWGNSLDAGEEAWVKLRFGNASAMNYLGSNLDGYGLGPLEDNDADATPEIWWMDEPVDDVQFFFQDISPYVTGAGTYYLEIGAALSDWDVSTEGFGMYLDNVNLVVV